MQQEESDVHLCHVVQDSPHLRRWWPTKALCMHIVYIVKGKSSIPLQISKTTTLSPTRNSRTLAAVAKMCFTLKQIYNTTTMRNTWRKYSFLFLVCMHVNNLCLTSALNYIPFSFLLHSPLIIIIALRTEATNSFLYLCNKEEIKMVLEVTDVIHKSISISRSPSNWEKNGWSRL